MNPLIVLSILWLEVVMLVQGAPLSLGAAFQRSLALIRLKRGAPTGNVYDPPLLPFPAKENAPFWNPPPYPFPSTPAPPPQTRHKLQYYDPNNPYLDPMTDSIWPNYGLGLGYGNPTLIGGGLNWPTGNALMPSDHFNGTLAFAKPIYLRVGMQGGPTFPWQNPQYIKTAKDINDANTLSQFAQMQSQSRLLNSLGNTQGAVPSGFIPAQQFPAQQQALPVQQQFPLQQQQLQQLQQQRFFSQPVQSVPQMQPSFSSNPFSTG